MSIAVTFSSMFLTKQFVYMSMRKTLRPMNQALPTTVSKHTHTDEIDDVWDMALENGLSPLSHQNATLGTSFSIYQLVHHNDVLSGGVVITLITVVVILQIVLYIWSQPFTKASRIAVTVLCILAVVILFQFIIEVIKATWNWIVSKFS